MGHTVTDSQWDLSHLCLGAVSKRKCLSVTVMSGTPASTARSRAGPPVALVVDTGSVLPPMSPISHRSRASQGVSAQGRGRGPVPGSSPSRVANGDRGLPPLSPSTGGGRPPAVAFGTMMRSWSEGLLARVRDSLEGPGGATFGASPGVSGRTSPMSAGARTPQRRESGPGVSPRTLVANELSALVGAGPLGGAGSLLAPSGQPSGAGSTPGTPSGLGARRASRGQGAAQTRPRGPWLAGTPDLQLAVTVDADDMACTWRLTAGCTLSVSACVSSCVSVCV